MSIPYSPKKAAVILLRDYTLTGGVHPQRMTKEDMTTALQDFDWRITDKRRESILRQTENVLAPLMHRLDKLIDKMAERAEEQLR